MTVAVEARLEVVQRVLQAPDEVVRVLDADGDTDEAVRDANLEQQREWVSSRRSRVYPTLFDTTRGTQKRMHRGDISTFPQVCGESQELHIASTRPRVHISGVP